MNPLTLEQQYRTESQCQGNPPSSVSLECPADCYGIDTSGHVGMERQQTALRRATSGVFRLVASGKDVGYEGMGWRSLPEGRRDRFVVSRRNYCPNLHPCPFPLRFEGTNDALVA